MAQTDTNSQEVLRDEILADARRQAERLLRRAERESLAMIEQAEKESQQYEEEKLAAAKEQAERKRTLALAAVPVQIVRMRAIHMEQQLQAVYETARQRLGARQGFDYAETLAALASEAIQRMEGNAFLLELSQTDRKQFGAGLIEAVKQRTGRADLELSLAPASEDVAHGVIVRDPAGRQVWDNRLEQRLARNWPQLRSELAVHLGLQVTAKPTGGQS